MKDFEQMIKESLSEVMAVGLKPGKIEKWVINRRAKSRWGLCKKIGINTFEIQIAERLLEDEVSDMACKDTIVHEILHTCRGCHGHTGLWKTYADLMNRTYGYSIKRTTSSLEKGLEELPTKEMAIKYVFRCKNCGAMLYRKKKSRFTEHYKYYGCGRCGAKRAFVKLQMDGMQK